jgi:hypothetical protein
MSAVIIALAVAQLSAQPSRGLRDVLARAGAYLAELEQQMSGVVAEETYVQEVNRVGGSTSPRLEQRQLKSDLLLLRPQGEISWVQFRDVFEVDGRPVRDREERLTALFLKPDASALQRIASIRRESARYNIGSVQRTMNIPVVPLSVLVPKAQPRFEFKVASSGTNIRAPAPPGREPSFRTSVEVWIVAFEERRGPTLIRLPTGANIFSRGRLWIEPASGRLMLAEMITENRNVRAQLNVSYQVVPPLDYMVPVEMTEKYLHKSEPRETTGRATYANFRQFRVQVDEKLTPIQ